MIPDQHTKQFLRQIEAVDSSLSSIAAQIRDGSGAFWADPVGNAPKLQAQSRACGVSPLEVWDMHAALIAVLVQFKPGKMAWFAGVPFEVPFLESGDFDMPELQIRWDAYLASLPPPEPDPDEEVIEP